MSTVREVAQATLARLDSNANIVLAAKWVSSRYQQLVEHLHLNANRKVRELTVPAAISAGTVSVTRGSKTITGDATAYAAWSSDIVGRFIRVGVAWYEISAFSVTTITLTSAYAEETEAAGTYHIVPRRNPLVAGIRKFGSFVHGRTRVPLAVRSLSDLDRHYPGRSAIGGTPLVYAENTLDPNSDIRSVEIYPPPLDDAEMFYYIAYEKPRDLDIRDNIPSTIPDHVLIEGAMIDLMRHKMSEALGKNTPGSVEEAALWRNEYRAQETRWKQVMGDAARADGGEDEASFILNYLRTGTDGEDDIKTARDHILADWTGLS